MKIHGIISIPHKVKRHRRNTPRKARSKIFGNTSFPANVFSTDLCENSSWNIARTPFKDLKRPDVSAITNDTLLM